ncbi:MAG: SIR2 family protein, partial [Anaerolineales bacterium]|nr:SIR2 family protein [Anaerolineales bacterium]
RLYARLKKSGMSYPVVASLIEEHCKTRDQFIEGIRDMLYADFPFHRVRFDRYNHWDFVRFVREGHVPPKFRQGKKRYMPNPTLRSVGALCLVRVKHKSSGRFEVNPKIHAVATLNVDALLQTYISTLTTRHLMRTVEDSSANVYPGQLNLYHMHGYLHYAAGEADSSLNAVEGIVFTEQDYYDFFNQPNRIFNYTFLYLLREYSCLFIGFSMQDENIRRMLYYSKLERLHAISNKMSIPIDLMKRGLISDEQKREIREQVGRHFAIMQKSNIPKLNEAMEDTLGALGVHVLWIKDFSEIPTYLKKLYESDPEQKGKWTAVYGREKK